MGKRMPVFGGFCSLLLLALALFAYVSDATKKDVGFYDLKRGDMHLKLTNYGATVLSLFLPDKHGKVDDVVLGFESIGDYTNDTTYFGAIVGRVANRIAGASFTLDDHHYKLVANEGPNMLHGGQEGFSDVIWTVTSHREDSHITFEYESFDREEGFPGKLAVSVTYMFIKTNMLAIKMQAWPKTKATPVNLASHTYWNLAGQASGTILSHHIELFASDITPVDDKLIPTGQLQPITGGSPFDFNHPRAIGSEFKQLSNGYDINYVLNGTTSKRGLRKAAVVHESSSGRKMELWTNKPGLQFYTGNNLGNVTGKGGFTYPKNGGLCLETQGFPDSVNHHNFPSQIVRPGETYLHVMVYRFTAD